MYKENTLYSSKNSSKNRFIKIYNDFYIFELLNDFEEVKSINMFNYNPKFKNCKKSDSIIETKNKDLSFKSFVENKTILSFEIKFSGFYNLCGYIIDFTDTNITIQCIDEKSCKKDGIAFLLISDISEIQFSSEVENKITKFAEQIIQGSFVNKKDKILKFGELYEIYYRDVNSFLVGKIYDYDKLFYKIIGIDLMGNNDSICFVKKEKVFMLKKHTLYLNPYEKLDIVVDKYFHDVEYMKSFVDIINHTIKLEKNISVICDNIIQKVKVFDFNNDNIKVINHSNNRKIKLNMDDLACLILDKI